MVSLEFSFILNIQKSKEERKTQKTKEERWRLLSPSSLPGIALPCTALHCIALNIYYNFQS